MDLYETYKNDHLVRDDLEAMVVVLTRPDTEGNPTQIERPIANGWRSQPTQQDVTAAELDQAMTSSVFMIPDGELQQGAAGPHEIRRRDTIQVADVNRPETWIVVTAEPTMHKTRWRCVCTKNP